MFRIIGEDIKMEDFGEEDENAYIKVELEEYEGDQDLAIASRDFEKIANSRMKSGFVEGAEAGKEEGLKEGFSSGFSSGLVVSTPWAILRGQVNALMVYHRTLQQGKTLDEAKLSTALAKLQKLVSTVQEEEEKWKKTQISSDRQTYETETAKTMSNDDSTEGGAVAMDIEDSGAAEAARSGSSVRYGEMVENIQVPSVVDSLRKRLNSISVESGAINGVSV